MAERIGGNPDSTWVARSDLRMLVKQQLGEETWLATDEDLTIHETDTTNVHGIADTSKLIVSESTAAGGDLTGTYPNPTVGAEKVTTGKIANLAITLAKLGPESVGEEKIANLAIGTGKLANLAVTEGKLAAGAVTNAKIGEGAVGSTKLANESVTSAKIGLLAVTETKYAENSIYRGALQNEIVSPAKLSTETKQSFLNQAAQTLASAATLTVSREATLVNITGTTSITKINATVAGHLIVLKFAGALTLTKGENLKLKENFVTTELDTITLICDGTNWFETSRSVN